MRECLSLALHEYNDEKSQRWKKEKHVNENGEAKQEQRECQNGTVIHWHEQCYDEELALAPFLFEWSSFVPISREQNDWGIEQKRQKTQRKKQKSIEEFGDNVASQFLQTSFATSFCKHDLIVCNVQTLQILSIFMNLEIVNHVHC